MRQFIGLLAVVVLCLLISSVFAEDKIYGSNTLRGNPNLSAYLENDQGIPTYIEGNLSDRVTAKGGEVAATYSFFEDNRGAFKMTAPAEELKVVRMDIDDLGMSHVRLSQLYQNIPVVGGELISHFSADGKLKTVNGQYYHDIALDVAPRVTADFAIDAASADLESFFGKGEPGQPELVIFPWNDTYYLTWRVFLYSDSPMGRWEYFIDAGTGEVVFSANRIMNENDIGTGYGVMGDFRDSIETNYSGSTYQMIDRTRRAINDVHGHDGQMPASNDIRTNIAGSSLPGTLATDTDNLWDQTNQRPAVDGQVYTGLVYDYMLHHLGRNGYDDNGSSMLTIVNYSGEGDNNAYWDGSRIVVWSWSTGWRSLAGCPDVIAHEWGHAITETTSNLVYQKEAGALNESFSDMMGAAFEFYHPELDEGDWDVGENGQTSGSGFRSMEDPHSAGDPDFYGTTDPYWYDVDGCTPSYFNDYCGVHTNSGVGNKWFFLLSDGGTHHSVTVTGIGVQNAIMVAYRANALYWTSNTDYHQAALATISAANDLDVSGTWAMQASAAWNAVGVSTPGPSITISYPDGLPNRMVPDESFSFSVIAAGTLGGVPVDNSGKLYYSLDGGPFVETTMTQTPSRYIASLPGAPCGSTYQYYVSVDEATTGTVYDPSPTDPFFVAVAETQTVSFADDFQTDQGWTVSGDATEGMWERAVPANGGSRGDPASDYDGSGMCFVTDNGTDADIDGGTTYLDSPDFDMAGSDGLISYARWYSNDFGNAPFSDDFKVYVSNNSGASWVLVETVGPVDQASGGWNEHSFWVSDFVTPTANVRIRFEADDLGEGSVVEAGVDAVSVLLYACESTPEPLAITTDDLIDWTAGVAYSQGLQATGGVGNHSWIDLNGDLAGTGLTLSTSGVLSGMPIVSGLLTFTAQVTDEDTGVDQKVFNFTINEAVSITTEAIVPCTVSVAASRQLTATGGTGTVTWSDINNDLNGTGLALSSAGLLSGMVAQSGSISFTARASDGIGSYEDKYLTVDIMLPYVCGDANGDEEINVADAVYMINYVFKGGSAPDPLESGDANCDGDDNVADAVYVINYVFKGGQAPCCPQ